MYKIQSQTIAEMQEFESLKSKIQDHEEHLFSNSPYLNDGKSIIIYNNSLRLESKNKKSQFGLIPERKKGDIRKFSVNSKRRFVKELAHINLICYGNPLFVTLTYRNTLPKDGKELQRHLNLFLTKLRRYRENFHYVWRLEFQKRGAPHFHLVLLPLFSVDKKYLWKYRRLLINNWRESIGDWDADLEKYAVKTDFVEGKKNVFSYISKYATKPDEIESNTYFGRRFGMSRDMNQHPIVQTFISNRDFYLFRKLVYNFLKKKNKLNEQFEKYLLTDPSIEVLLNPDEIEQILQQFQLERQTPLLSDFILEYEHKIYAIAI